MQHLSSSLALLGLLAVAPLGACDDAAPTNPTWIDDVQPQVQANCIRCHSHPSRGGAPDSFRLDVYRSTYLIDKTEIRGAEVMAEFMKQRAGAEGSMPPDFARGDHMRDTFKNWFEQGAGLPLRGIRANNTAPLATLLTELPIVDKEMVNFDYQVADADGDIVYGRFTVNGIEVADGLHSGQGSVEFYSGTFPEGDHEIVAEMSDGHGVGETIRRGFVVGYPFNRVIGTLRVRHSDGNTAPTVDIVRLFPERPIDLNDLPNSELEELDIRDILIADIESPIPLRISIDDPDADTHTVSISAFRGDEEIGVVSGLAVSGETEFDWDTTQIPEGPGWRLRVIATDSQSGVHTIETGRIYISHQRTSETFDSIIPIFSESCGVCHIPATFPSRGPDFPPRFGRIPYFNFTLDGIQPDAADSNMTKLAYEEVHRKVGYNQGNIYRRLIENRNMPPASAEGLLARDSELLSDENRARLADYLLGGSPR